MDTFKIRKPHKHEIPLLVKMQVAMAAETEPFKLDPATVTRGMTAVMEDPSKGSYWVAEDSNAQLAGMLMTIPEWSDWRNGTVLWVHSVYVVPGARKQGVYKRLYLHLKSMVENDPSLRGLRLYVEKQNAQAQAVYKKLGMSNEHYHLYEWMKGF